VVKVGVAELKSRLSEYLRVVRRGGAILVLDRDTPIARIVPVARQDSHIQVRRSASGKVGDVEMPPPLALPFDVMELLDEERGTR
jgi:prevent-host-death family protein